MLPWQLLPLHMSSSDGLSQFITWIASFGFCCIFWDGPWGCSHYNSSLSRLIIDYLYTTVLPKFGDWIFNVFKKTFLCSPRLYFIQLKCWKTVILLNIITFKNKCFLFKYILKCNVFCDGKAELSETITQVFSVTWSFRNHHNMLIWCSNISHYYQ